MNRVEITGFAKLCTNEVSGSGEVEGEPRGGDIPEGKLKQADDDTGSLGGITTELVNFLRPAHLLVEASDVSDVSSFLE